MWTVLSQTSVVRVNSMVLLYHEKQVRLPPLNRRHYEIAADLPSDSHSSLRLRPCAACTASTHCCKAQHSPSWIWRRSAAQRMAGMHGRVVPPSPSPPSPSYPSPKIHFSISSTQIAQELDAMEQSFMQEGGVNSEDFLKFAAEGSGNVANDGMFSIQVCGLSIAY